MFRARVLVLGLCIIAGCKVRPKAAAPANAALASSEIAIGDAAYQPLLLRGFYESTGGWRWTARTFAIAITPPAGDQPTSLTFDFTLPVEVTSTISAVTLTARANGVEVGHRRYDKEGRRQFAAAVPANLLPAARPAEVEFELDRAARDEAHNREIGVIAISAALTHGVHARFDREAETARARQGYQYLLARRNLIVPPEKQ